jgi:phosphotransferase system HPr (HPr) family protein
MDKRYTRKVIIKNQNGLHARPASQLVHLANTYKSEIKLFNSKTNVLADCRSVLSIMLLAATQNTELDIQTQGIDAKEAIDNVEKLLLNIE